MASVETFIDGIKQRWNLLAEAAAIISAAIGAFLLPPASGLTDSRWVTGLGPFILAGVLALWFVPTSLWRTQSQVWRWWTAALLMLLLGLGALFQYSGWNEEWTVPYPEFSTERSIRGESMLRSATAFRDSLLAVGQPAGDPQLMMHFQGEAENIWPATEIRARTKKLYALYLATVLLFGSFVVTVLQATFCLTNAEPRAAASKTGGES